MEQLFVDTNLGKIAVYKKNGSQDKIPVLFLHGVYFDHNLWEAQTAFIDDRDIILLDMPMHGNSKEIKKSDWTLNDCTDMLLEVINKLKINKSISIGHSWGSMTIIRAANKEPERFSALGLCNMPFKESSKKVKRNIKLQQIALVFRKFYMKQAARALMGKDSISKNPAIIRKLTEPMSKLSNEEIKYTDTVVRINADDSSEIIKNLEVPSIAIIGEEDYVGIPPLNEVITVKGGHVSPIESPNEVNLMINKLISISEKEIIQ
jgi:pimeloyl-ACP methyl ester carboxylesterase